MGGGSTERFKKNKSINNVISCIPKNWETFLFGKGDFFEKLKFFNAKIFNKLLM